MDTMRRSLQACTLAASGLYFSIGVSGAGLFCSATQGDVLTNFDLEAIGSIVADERTAKVHCMGGLA